MKFCRLADLLRFVYPFQVSRNSQLYLCRLYLHMTPLIRGNLKETALLIIITWPEMGKQNIQALGGSIGFLLNVGARARARKFLCFSRSLIAINRALSKFRTMEYPYFLCRKTLRNGIELRQDRYLSMLRLSNQSPFYNRSHGVLFSVDRFFRRRRGHE